MKKSRRQFLAELISSGLLLHGIPARAFFLGLDSKEWIAISGQIEGPSIGGTSLILLNASSLNEILIDTSVRVHEWLQNPVRPKWIIGVGARSEKKCSVVDIDSRREIQTFSSTPEFNFSGHASFLPDGKTLAFAERHEKNALGKVIWHL